MEMKDITMWLKKNKTIVIAGMVGFIVAVILIGIASAEPFLVCDPQAGVTKYRLEFTGSVDPAVEVAAETDGSLKYDLVNWGNGLIQANAYAGKEVVLDGQPQGVWRWSEPTPFALDAGRPSPPAALDVVP